MKKLNAILLILLYLIPTFGITGSVHYCGGEVSSVSVNGFGKDKECGCDKENMSMDCCNDKGFSYKIDDEQYKTSTLSTFKIFKYIDLIAPHFTVTLTSFLNNEIVFNISHHPPNNVKLHIYILYRVFRI